MSAVIFKLTFFLRRLVSRASGATAILIKPGAASWPGAARGMAAAAHSPQGEDYSEQPGP
ncbi:hypothetical protein HYN48_02785 [Flavobacterium magnum]|uniref:Uncharacterized protein n=1 Tax=Flavobacterium magnum TaxID=2162713 RepID=A0A2S0RBR5_9FLAO|nr:hypothetical protein HYN48_02785 [Flavobacterium magnum]